MTEIAAVAAKYDKFQEMGAEVIAISTDSPFVHKAWVDNELSKSLKGTPVPYIMASDSDTTISQMYGVYDEEDKIAVRGVFILNPEGIVQTYEVLTPPVGRNIFETLRQLKAAKMVSENAGEVAPCGWEPGKKTLKPSEELVGKVWEQWSPENDLK